MIYNLEEGWLFLHVPKTAGTSLKEAFRVREGDIITAQYPNFVRKDKNFHIDILAQHQNAKFFRKMPLFRNLNYYAVCRNPFDWMVSLYFSQTSKRYQEDVEKYGGKKTKQYFDMIASKNFDEYVEMIKEPPQSFYIDHYTQMFKYEEISELERYFNISLQVYNKSTHDHYSKYYTNERTKEILITKYEQDFINFGYSFNI